MEVNQGASTSKGLDQEPLIKEDDILPGCSSFDDFVQTAYPLIMSGVKHSYALPVEEQFLYYSTFPEFKDTMREEELNIQKVMQKLLHYCGGRRSIAAQCPEDKFDLIVDMNDILLGRTSKNLQEIDGTGRNPVSVVGDFADELPHTKNVSGSWNRRNISSTNRRHAIPSLARPEDQNPQTRIIKPQLYFKDKIDNRNETWVPKIKEKPNALKPLSILLTRDENNVECYTHPYEYELSLFKVDEGRLCPINKPRFPKPMKQTPLVMIDQESQLDEFISDLLQESEIAVDVEHHSFRTFMGITCLLQISTRENDYLVDTLQLRHALHKLNEVFTRPTILKIFHSADSDIEWLQRDLGIYVINMFDTYQAAKVLLYPKLGLSYLLKKFCNIVADKRYQLYDWRIRPLPQNAKDYARTDTHFLIYIYEKMNNELYGRGGGKTNLLSVVYERSTDTCKRIYHKPILKDDSYMTLYRKSRRLFDSRQLYALKEIYKWRDCVAREEDESPGYILSNHMMMQICQTLPREMQGILACCNPIPPSVKEHLLVLHKIILKAKEQPLILPFVEESAKPSSQFSASRDFDLEAKISTYTHDNSGLEFRDDYPTLLDSSCGNLVTDNDFLEKDFCNLESSESKLPIIVNTVDEFIDLERERENMNVEELSDIMDQVKFITPYQRYKQVLPYSRKLEEEEREKRILEEEKNQERLLRTQYNDIPKENEADTQNKDSQEKENILKRPVEARTEQIPLSSDNPGKKRRMLQKFDVSDPSVEEDNKSNLLQIIKKESEQCETQQEPVSGSSNEVSVGVVGGVLSVENNRNRVQKNKFQRRNYKDVTPYGYQKVDFSKFHSAEAQQSSRVQIPDSRLKNKMKRNQQFKGRRKNGSRKGGGKL